MIGDKEAIFALQMCHLLSHLSEKDYPLLAKCLQAAVNFKDETGLNIFKKTRPPTTVSDLKRFFLKGPRAIIPNLPHPQVRKTRNGSHAYTTLTEVIAHLLASNTAVEQFSFSADVCLDEGHILTEPNPPTIAVAS